MHSQCKSLLGKGQECPPTLSTLTTDLLVVVYYHDQEQVSACAFMLYLFYTLRLQTFKCPSNQAVLLTDSSRGKS